MKFKIKLQITVLPFIVLPIIMAGLIYSSIGRNILKDRKSEILELRLESLYRFAENEYSSLIDLGLINTNFFNEKSWANVESFAEQFNVPGDPLFIIRESEVDMSFLGEMGSATGSLNELGLKDEGYLYFYKKLSDWDMVIISATEESSIYRSIDNGTRIFILFSLINLIVSIVIVYIISHRITKPMVDLTALAKEMANRNLSVRSTVKSNDEIGILSDNFNIMVERLDEATKDLEHKVEIRTKELRTSLKELQLAQNHLVEAEKMASLGALVAGISHEINTPIGIGITAISHIDEVLHEIESRLNKGSLTKTEFNTMLTNSMESSKIALNSLKRGGELVSTFKKVAADQHIEEKTHINIKNQMDNVLLTLKPQFKNSKISLSMDVDPDIILYCYPGAIWQVTSNIILNALIHAFDPGVEGHISINIREYDSILEIKITDDGKGIHEADVVKIFEPFFTTKRDRGGTGLGLNIVYNIVTQLFKGKIECSSKLGKGTTFNILIPML